MPAPQPGHLPQHHFLLRHHFLTSHRALDKSPLCKISASAPEGCLWHSACWQGCAECAAVGKSPSWALGHCEPLLFWSMPVLMAGTSRMGAPSQCGGPGLWTLSPQPRAFTDSFLILPLFSGADQPHSLSPGVLLGYCPYLMSSGVQGAKPAGHTCLAVPPLYL